MDLEFVRTLIGEFISCDEIKRKLSLIEGLNLKSGKKTHDYEKWLQIEFAMFLDSLDCDRVSGWGREKRYVLDGRRKSRISSKNTTTVDFWIKRKYQKYSGEILIEFKRARSINGCVKQMIKDGALLRKIKASESDVRTFWMVGFHPNENDSHKAFEKAFTQEEKLNEWVNYRKFKTEEIAGTGLSFSIFTLDET
ncbi:hypothetical protein [Shewanella sp. MBTL60-007]|uniref:hypothetical protein n=1 Tax=Shewanella sp. MBTL60-007 TaxID=2815911 RepID=UPI001BBFD643|nr:hypothetical protein [Shewanella sp. MBTL60-007]GIU26455.1 hypothetical protein TUM3792_33210 [Shewanella sp. MBTL60-007]